MIILPWYTRSLPASCTSALLGGAGDADAAADNVAQSTSLSTVVGGANPEFEYYQFHYDHPTFDIQLTLRVHAGANLETFFGEYVSRCPILSAE